MQYEFALATHADLEQEEETRGPLQKLLCPAYISAIMYNWIQRSTISKIGIFSQRNEKRNAMLYEYRFTVRLRKIEVANLIFDLFLDDTSAHHIFLIIYKPCDK